jgi:hypothetical protein
MTTQQMEVFIWKGYDSAQTNLIDNIEGLQNEFRVSSFRNRTELQSYLEGLMLYSIN